MGSKGLFELVFLLIMMVLILPTTTQHKTVVTSSTQAQVNELALMADAAIADALADTTFVNCVIAAGDVYKPIMNNYLTALSSDYNALGNNCIIHDLGANLNIYELSGDFVVSCSKNNASTSTNISKKVYYKKTVTANGVPSGGNCKVTVADNYNGDILQVDYNLSN